MADSTLKHPKASDLTSTGNDLLKLYRIQKGIHSRNLLDMAMEDSTESSQEAVRWTDQEHCQLSKQRTLVSIVSSRLFGGKGEYW